MKVSKAEAERYVWGDGCDGWRLLTLPDLRIIQERVPSGKSETWHAHRQARQFFYVLAGSLAIETAAGTELLRKGDGLEIEPGTMHRVFNGAASDAEFLVISSPTTEGDRIEGHDAPRAPAA